MGLRSASATPPLHSGPIAGNGKSLPLNCTKKGKLTRVAGKKIVGEMLRQ